MSNSLRQVRSGDLMYLKDGTSQFMGWYVRNCEAITEASEILGEDEGDIISTILNQGLRCVEDSCEIVKDSRRGDEI